MERYLKLGKKYLSEGLELLSKGDLAQASEKLWGAAAEAVKAVADSRGWEHFTHRSLAEAVSRLYEETGDPEIPRLYASAESLHANFYEGFASPGLVKLYAEDAEALIEKLRQMLLKSPENNRSSSLEVSEG